MSILFDRATVYAFDGEGRLITGFEHGRTLQRALDGRVLVKTGGRGLGPWQRRRRWLTASAGLQAVIAVYARMRDHADELRRVLPDGWAERLLGWDGQRLAAERERFQSVYVPVGMLPPDQYRAVVLQAAFSCPWNRCTFCTLYRGQRFRVRGPIEFEDHLRRVREFFGTALPSRRWLFVGEGDALSVPTGRLAALMSEAAEAFPIAPPALAGRDLANWLAGRDEGYVGFSGFLDPAAGTRKGVADFAELRSLGLRRAHIGLETGHPPLYQALNKPGDVGSVQTSVASLHGAGIQASIIVLVGVGGHRYADAHVRDTLATLAAMDLGRDDLVYLSILRIARGSAYAQWAEAEGIERLSPRELLAQYEALAGALRRPGGPHVSAYDIAELDVLRPSSQNRSAISA